MTPPSDKKLFLLDAFALIYRAYFAFSKTPRINSKGQNTSAAFGFTNALIDVIKKENPSHLAVVFDAPSQTNRAEEHSFYKANREEMPEDIRSMIEPIKKIIEAFNIPILLKDGFEADDVIGTLAKEAERKGFVTYMMTPDKDFGQLVSENIFMYKPSRGGNGPEVWGVKEVCERFEIDNPLKVIDILGLWGDAVDNIPGIPGIGEKNAKKLIGEYGSVENLIAHADDLKGKQKENVIEFAEQGMISKMLATIILDVPVEFNEEKLKLDHPNEEALKAIFTELEFRNLSKRILGEEIVVTVQGNSDENNQLDLFGSQSMLEEQTPVEVSDLKTVATEKPNYHLITQPEERANLLKQLLGQTAVCFDTETSSLEAINADIVGLSFSWKAREAYYVAFPKNFDEAKAILHEFLPFFSSEKIEKIAHNVKYDAQVLTRYEIAIEGPIFDTMIAHYLIHPDGKHSMDFLSEYYLGYKPISIETVLGKKGKNQRNMTDLEPRDIVDYASEDADITFQLKLLFEAEINKSEDLKKLFYDLEMPVAMVLKEMEEAGINLDVDFLKNYSKEIEIDLVELEKGILADAGTQFNLDSPKQLGEVLFDHLKISDKAKKTKTGQYATAEDVLSKHINDHPIVPKILDYRQLRKLKSTYVDALPALVNANDGRIHTHYMQTVVATGRLSSNNPNLQNIPIRSEKGREIRKAFIAKNEDYLLMSADYSQIELRVIAALSDDKNMIAAFQEGKDIHAATAAKVFNVPLEEVTREQRSQAKAVNFGIIYGQSAFGLSQNLGISRTEAKAIIDNYFEQYGRIKEFMAESIDSARDLGYVETVLHRRRYLADINSSNAIVRGFAERNAINAPIQGTAADIIKLAMIKVQSEIKRAKLKSRMLLQVHDELVFDVHHSEQEEMKILVKTAMESALELSVPFIVEIDIAKNWLDAH